MAYQMDRGKHANKWLRYAFLRQSILFHSGDLINQNEKKKKNQMCPKYSFWRRLYYVATRNG